MQVVILCGGLGTRLRDLAVGEVDPALTLEVRRGRRPTARRGALLHVLARLAPNGADNE